MTGINELAKIDKRYYEGFWKRLGNRVVTTSLKFISYLPFWLLYLCSDFFYFVLRYIIRYRKKVIYTNLENSFPEKSPGEISSIANKFYSHFCDVFFETIKAYSMSAKQFDKRFHFRGVEIFDKYYQQGTSVVLLGMHYNNWEWNSASQRKSNHKVLVIYNPIRGNKAFEDFMLKIRERWGCKSIPVYKSARTAIEFNRGSKPAILWLAADQTPPPTTKLWMTFLHQETPFFSGPEKIAHRTNQPVFFHHVRKIKRGVYEVFFYKLFENPAEVKEKEVLLAYAKKMEEIISQEPQYYLWSHRRWKHKRPEDIPLIS